MLNEFLELEIVHVRKIGVAEKWVNPFVEGVAAIVDRRFFDWISFAIGKRAKPDFGLPLESEG